MDKPKKPLQDEVLPPIRVSHERKTAYQRAADAAGKKLSAWIKGVLDRAAKRVK